MYFELLSYQRTRVARDAARVFIRIFEFVMSGRVAQSFLIEVEKQCADFSAVEMADFVGALLESVLCESELSDDEYSSEGESDEPGPSKVKTPVRMVDSVPSNQGHQSCGPVMLTKN